ncbi:hypothetical protein AB3459_03185, partial [Pseudomonas aeruginosa]
LAQAPQLLLVRRAFDLHPVGLRQLVPGVGDARLRPTESRFRNDLGVALLKRGDRVGARFEFITALELQQGGKLPATNLLGLLYLQGDREDAQRLIERLQLDARDIRAAEARARSWGAVPTPGAAPASDDPLAELPAEANMHTAMANEAP